MVQTTVNNFLDILSLIGYIEDGFELVFENFRKREDNGKEPVGDWAAYPVTELSTELSRGHRPEPDTG